MIRSLLILIFLFALPALATSPCDELLSARVQLQKKWVGGEISESIYLLENKILDEKEKALGLEATSIKKPADQPVAETEQTEPETLQNVFVPRYQDHWESVSDNFPAVEDVSDFSEFLTSRLELEPGFINFEIFNPISRYYIANFKVPSDKQWSVRDFSAREEKTLMGYQDSHGQYGFQMYITASPEPVEIPACRSGKLKDVRLSSEGNIILFCSDGSVGFWNSQSKRRYSLNLNGKGRIKLGLRGLSINKEILFGVLKNKLEIGIYKSDNGNNIKHIPVPRTPIQVVVDQRYVYALLEDNSLYKIKLWGQEDDVIRTVRFDLSLAEAHNLMSGIAIKRTGTGDKAKIEIYSLFSGQLVQLLDDPTGGGGRLWMPGQGTGIFIIHDGRVHQWLMQEELVEKQEAVE